jgi:hypothetical protein
MRHNSTIEDLSRRSLKKISQEDLSSREPIYRKRGTGHSCALCINSSAETGDVIMAKRATAEITQRLRIALLSAPVQINRTTTYA